MGESVKTEDINLKDMNMPDQFVIVDNADLAKIEAQKQ